MEWVKNFMNTQKFYKKSDDIKIPSIYYAIGINSKGDEISIPSSYNIGCYGKNKYYLVIRIECNFKNLISLEVPEGITTLECSNNNIENIILPKSLLVLHCHNNKLKEIVIPEKLTFLKCENNLIKELKLSNNIVYLRCDRNVKGLEDSINNLHIELN